ncbi:hypothetical protein B0H19DRAFT_691336 [Mycena capillaripes]|nr:hypothetical protein B0H19DRAFT_691336 [Mycena capillaripes]
MSGSRTRSPGIQQPQPGRIPTFGSSLFPDSAERQFGGQFGYDQRYNEGQSGRQSRAGLSGQQSSYTESNFAKQSSNRQENTYSNSTSRRSEEVKQNFERTSRALEEYRSRITVTKLTLADCELDLQLPLLTLKPRKPDHFISATLNLDDLVGNIDGELVWGVPGAVKFSESCESIRIDETFLLASCPRGKDEYVQASLDLNEHIAYNAARRCFVAVTPDPAFTELMSSANWMNFTVVTRPDMRLLLRNPAFQNAISSVAQRAVDEVMNQMREVMALAVEEAVTMVSARSEEYVQSEMESLIRMATKSAAYTGLGELKLMELHQRRAWNVFAPLIDADTVPEKDGPHMY